METIKWNEVEARAKKMTDHELKFAIKDCLEASKALDGCEPKGKDSGYYMDEATIYKKALDSRQPKKVNIYVVTLSHDTDSSVMGAYKLRVDAEQCIEDNKNEYGNPDEYEWEVTPTTLQ